MSNLRNVLCKLGPRYGMPLIKTFANAWTTTCRLHEAVILPCIFGCSGCKDNLNHYLCCDPLWTVVISCSSRQSEHLHASPCLKLGLYGPSSLWCQLTAIAFSCYHAIKMGHRSELQFFSNTGSGHLCQVHDRLLEYAKVFSMDLLKDT